MVDLEKLNRNKEGILSALRVGGPSLPVRIAKTTGLSPLFTAAFLSELKAEQKIKVSSMRVGSSPIYYLDGQEERLGGFVEHLNIRERETFELLKKSQVLEDSEQVPVVRVALRAIKDFAVPVKVRIDGELRLFWKYFLLGDDEIGGFVKKGVKQKREEVVEKKVEEKKETEKKKEAVSKEDGDVKEEVADEKKQISKIKHKEIQQGLIEEKVKKKEVENEFGLKVKDFLLAKDIEVLEVLEDKKRGFVAKVRIDGLFGKQSYYLISKDKKTVSDNDLVVALQRAQGERMPALVMCGGELTKKGKEHLAGWGNLVKFEKLNF